MPEAKQPLKVFLCHTSQDKPTVRELSRRLGAEGWIDLWLDEKKLLPGQDWRLKIEEAVETSDAVIICLSYNSVGKEGYVQKELRYAKEIALEKLEESVFLIPLRLDDCIVPRGLRFYQWVDYFGEKKEASYSALVEALKLRYEQKLRLEEEQRVRLGKEELKYEVAEQEKVERLAAQRAVLKKNFSQAKPFLRIGGVAGLVILIFWAVASTISQTFTPKATGGMPTFPVGLVELSATPVLFTKTTRPTVIQTKTPIPTSTFSPTATEPWLAEIVDEVGVEMVLVPAGEFTMGSDNGSPDEKPVRTTYLDSFYIDKYEVSNASYAVCVEKGSCDVPVGTDSYTRSSYYGNKMYADYPVIHVTWSMANEYCEWRQALLPDEARWEKAARGADGRIYPWGSNFDPTGANFCDYKCAFKWAEKKFNDQYNDTAPVNSYENSKSPYGVYNLSGNVWEWVAGWYFSDYSAVSDKVSFIPIKLGATEAPPQQRIVRGGSWESSIVYLRTTERHAVDADAEDSATGFRCARDAAPVAPRITLPPTETSTPSITPTGTSLTNTPEAPASGFVLISIDKIAYIGGKAKAKIRTQPGVQCSLVFYLPSGVTSKAPGVGNIIADHDGYCAWSWSILDNVNPGYGTAVLIAGGQTTNYYIKLE